MNPIRLILVNSTLLLSVSGCSLDVIPVHYSKINSAKEAKKPLERGENAPGAFTRTLGFSKNLGYAYDPAKVQLKDGAARLIGSKATKATIETTTGIPFAAIDGFSEVTGPGHRGQVKYQFSNDASAWFYHDGKKWSPAGPNTDTANTSREADQALKTFHTDVGAGDLYVKAILISTSSAEPVELKEIKIQAVAPKMDGWN